MEFTAEKGDLRYLATALAQLDAITAVPTRNAIIAGDYTRTRLLVYTPECAGAGGVTENAGLDGGARFAVTKRGLAAEFGSAKYRLNLMVPTTYADEPAVTGTGTIRVKAADMHEALGDVRAAGSPAVVIAVTKKGAVLRGDGGGSIDCWIPVPGAESDGTGYSRLSLDLLLPCMPKTADLTVDITLAPKGPTAMRFGDNMTYYQAPRT